MFRKFIWLLLVFFLAACSADKQQQEKPAKEAPKNEQTEKKSHLKPAETEGEFYNVTIPVSAEELAEMPPGKLTKDFDDIQETSMWVKKGVPQEIRSNFLTEMKGVIKVTEDPVNLQKAIMYYLGGSQYEPLVTPLLTYAPDFEEPLLPEAYKTDGKAAKKTEKPPKHVIILLDASSSMLLEADGRLKINTAKTAVQSFADAMGQDSQIALYTYGQHGSQDNKDKDASCTKIDEVYPLGAYNKKAFKQATDKIEAKGWTPLAGAIAQAARDHKGTEGDITLYIVSDGEETCSGNPVKEAEAFAKINPDYHVNVIGFQVDSKAESQLRAVAKAGNGEYAQANSLADMTNQIEKVWLPSGLDIVGLIYAKPGGFPVTMANQKVSDYEQRIRDAIKVENLRFQGAVELLLDEKLIDSQQADKLSKLIQEQKKLYEELADDKKKEKKALIDSEVKRINKKIDNYMKRIEKLRKAQQK